VPVKNKVANGGWDADDGGWDDWNLDDVDKKDAEVDYNNLDLNKLSYEEI